MRLIYPSAVCSVLLFAITAPLAAEQEQASSSAPKSSPNVLLITVDTLRPANLSCYGYEWKTSPNIDKLASEGTRFERAYTVIPLTGPAHFSLFTSRYPQEHGAVRNGLDVASDRTLVNFPQVLRANGYRNAGFVSGWPLNGRLTSLDEWFEHYDEDLTRTYQLVNSSRWAEDVTPPAMDWLKQNGKSDKPFFMWVHYFDPHSPYDFREHFADLQKNGSGTPAPVADEGMRERIRNYDTEIAYMDWHMGKLFDTLDALGLKDSTLVVLIADHGESLGEHDYVGHGRQLYEDTIRIPLIVRWPGKVKAGKVITTPVSILDVAPTIVDLTVGKTLEKNDAVLPFVGRTLAPALTNGENLTERRNYYVTFPGKKGFAPKWLSWIWISEGELPSKFGYLDGMAKFIWSPDEAQVEKYDVGRDPQEVHPQILKAGRQPYKTQTKHLQTWFARTESRASETRLSEKDLEVLKSLGYVQ
ncbi:MAG: sulfatase family protein [Bryobacteraceae bacterium]